MRDFEGRSLARPGEEIVDQGLAFDLGTVLSRRRMLQAIGIGLAGLGLAACTPDSPSPSAGNGEIPEETAGPFPGDGSNGPDALETSGIVRSDIRSSFGGASGVADGVPLAIELTILDLANGGRSFTGTAVYVWHCDREGRYSMYSAGATEANYLRGVQVADGSGKVRFTSIFPACYPGRWPHVHFEVYPDQASIVDASNVIATSQLALPEDACRAVYAQPGYEASVRTLAGVSLTTDGVFRDDGGVRQLGTVTGDITTGYTVALTVPIRA